MLKISSLLSSVSGFFVVLMTLAFILGKSVVPTFAGDKVYVCKYVGTPGVNESLQTGQNPIEVSVNALPNNWSIGSYFNDAHGRSFVLALVPQVPEPNVNNCPPPSTGGTPTATPTATPTMTPTATATGTSKPSATPTATATGTGKATPTMTATATATSNNGDVCPNIDGIQNSLPDGMHFGLLGDCLSFSNPGVDSGTGGAQVLGTSTGQVLGASTLAATGALENALFNSIFTLGSLLTSFGIMKNGKKKA